MFCVKCGKELREGAAFCDHCGAKATKKTLKLSPLSFVLGILLAVCLAAVFLLTGVMRFGSGGGSRGRIEGAGYSTPEEAMQAYLEAMKAGDFDAMYALYAVESYCEGYDLGRQIEYVGAFSPAFSGMYLGTPAESGGDAFVQDRNVEVRKAQITGYINNQLMALSAFDASVKGGDPDVLEEIISGQIIANPDQGIIETCRQMMSGISCAKDIQITGTVPPESLNEIYMSEKNREQLQTRADISGAGEIRSVVGSFTLAGKRFYLGMDAADYGGKWYLITAPGNIATITGASYTSGGLMPADDP